MKFDNIKRILSKYCIGIAGCGGLGSNCAVSLARVGIGKIIIADFDIIVESNLNRQYFFYNQIGQKKVFALKENILKINPDIIVEAHDIKLDNINFFNIYKNCNIIIEAFDLAEMKQMIIEEVLHKMPKTPIIAGIGIAGWGNNNNIKTKNIGNLYLCGDNTSETSDETPPLAPKVCIAANMQANQALEILLTKDNYED